MDSLLLYCRNTISSTYKAKHVCISGKQQKPITHLRLIILLIRLHVLQTILQVKGPCISNSIIQMKVVLHPRPTFVCDSALMPFEGLEQSGGFINDSSGAIISIISTACLMLPVLTSELHSAFGTGTLETVKCGTGDGAEPESTCHISVAL